MRRSHRSAFDENGFEAWGGYMEAKKAKLLDQFTSDASTENGDKQIDKSNIFNGISIYVNGYTDPSSDDLKRLMMLHGGQFHHYYSAEKTRFIIATNLADTKIKQMKGHPKVVKPAWIVDCVAAGKLLDFRPYLLYSNQSRSQPKISFLKSFSGEGGMCRGPSKKLESIPSTVTSNELSDGASTSASSSFRYQANNEDEDVESSEEIQCKTPTENDSPEDFGGEFSNSDNTEGPSTSSLADKVEQTGLDKKSRIPKAGEANFLSEFYSHSRLHHISTMGAMFKKYVADLRKNHNGSFPGKDELKSLNQQTHLECDFGDSGKIIMHIDVDCFFVSVGLRDRPELQGKPVAVTHAKGNPPSSSTASASRAAEIECYRNRMSEKLGQEAPLRDWMKDAIEEGPSSMAEIASCNYEARKAGLKNGMFLGAALKKCPNLITIPYDFEGYKEVSYTLYNTVASFTLDIEAVSCDEMFVDCTSVLKDTNTSPLQFATFLREKIKALTKCPASTGFGSNILQARLATKKAKPDGQFHLLQDDVNEFMKDISVRDLPGVGSSLAMKLNSRGIKTCGDLQKLSLNHLQSMCGHKTGQVLHQHCRGIDQRALDLEHQRKSVSAEVNYGIRFQQPEEAKAFLKELAEEVHSRLMEIGSKGRCITLKIMVKAKHAPTETAKFMGHGVCDNLSRSSTLLSETNDATVITREAVTLLSQLNVVPSSLRGMGIQVSKLVAAKETKGRSMMDFLSRGTRAEATIASSNSNALADAKPSPINEPVAGPSHDLPGISSLNSVTGLDQEFLAALPEDIRAEIIEDYRRSKGQIEPRQIKEEKVPMKQPTQDLQNISFSQVDPSFLEALPVDVRKQVIDDLKHQKELVAAETAKRLSNLRPLVLSPTKSTKVRSPIKKLPRSPKKATSPQKQKQIRGQTKLDVIFLSSSVKAEPEVVEVQDTDTESQETVLDFEMPSEAFKQQEEESDGPTGVLNVHMPTVEAMQLLREWVDSGDEPQPVDVELFSGFLLALVGLRKIFDVDRLLRTLHRKIESKNIKLWNATYQEIVNRVQPKIIQEFGSKLCVATLD